MSCKTIFQVHIIVAELEKLLIIDIIYWNKSRFDLGTRVLARVLGSRVTDLPSLTQYQLIGIKIHLQIYEFLTDIFVNDIFVENYFQNQKIQNPDLDPELENPGFVKCCRFLDRYFGQCRHRKNEVSTLYSSTRTEI